MEEKTPTDPVKHFSFPQCKTCMKQPCTLLRTGHVAYGRYIFIPRRHYAFADCIFSAITFNDVETYLKKTTFYRLKRHFNEVLNDITEAERLKYNQGHFLESWSDRFGRIEFLKHLWKNKVITAIGIPPGFEFDEKVKAYYAGQKS
jgi:hypothetical protein